MTIRDTFDIPEVPPAWWKDEPGLDKVKRAVKRDNLACESFEKLVAAGIKERELLEFLVGRAVWAFLMRKSKPWYFRSKMEPKTVAYFPVRLRKIAGQIEILNKCLAGGGLLSGQIPVPISGFAQTPEVLRRYADFISIASRKGRHYNQWAALDELIQFVQEETGKCRFQDLSYILTAVALDAGVDQCHFDTDALKQRPYRKRKLSSTNRTRYPRLRKK